MASHSCRVGVGRGESAEKEKELERLRFTLTASSITALILSIAMAPMLATAAGPTAWPQWGQNPQHTGQSSAVGQSVDRILADVVYDPFVPAEQKATFGDLLAHYQAPLLDGNDVFMEVKTGAVMKKIMPGLAGDLDPANTFVSGPLSADSGGNVYYNVLQLDPADPYGIDKSHDIPGSWLVKVSSDVATSVAYSTLVAGAPTTCDATFSLAQLPWPPTADAVVPTGPCGTQRPGINVAPAIAPDGTIHPLRPARFRTPS